MASNVLYPTIVYLVTRKLSNGSYISFFIVIKDMSEDSSFIFIIDEIKIKQYTKQISNNKFIIEYAIKTLVD